MRFTYTYRSSDGARHSDEIEAATQDAAFAALRARGIKPIRLTGADGGVSEDRRPWSPKWLMAAIVLCLLGVSAWWLASRRAGAPYRVMTPQGPATITVAEPLPRQAILGDRARVEQALRDGTFRHAAERWLAARAEPGRRPSADMHPTKEEFEGCLREPVRISSLDFTEIVDLKRMVEGMKREMRAYIAGGGTAEEYIAEVEKRQRLEMSYRERAEQKLGEMMSAGRAAASRSREAYDYWLKANASLKAMGIYEIPLPDALRGYQQRLGLDEYE